MKCDICLEKLNICDECGERFKIGDYIICIKDGQHIHGNCYDEPRLGKVIK